MLTIRATAPKAPQTPARKPAAKPGGSVAPAKKPGAAKDQLQLSKKPAPKPTPKPAPKPPAPPPPPPKPPVAESREQAITMALAGQPVLMPIDKQDPRELTLTAIGDEGGFKRFEARFGTDKFNIALADGQPLEAGLARAFQMIAQAPADLRPLILSVDVVDPTPETAHYKVAMTDLGGLPGKVELKRTGVVEGKAVFQIKLGEDTLEFKAPAENDLAWSAARAGSYYAQIPAALRPVLKTVVIENGPNPLDAYWEKTYNMPGFSSAASASSGIATFWNGHRNLAADTFHHEFGHLLGQRLSTKNNYTPDDWADAAKADGTEATNYAKASPDEDFAESWWVYLRLKNNNPAPYARLRTLEEFQAKFPNRIVILDAIYNGERKPREVTPARAAASSAPAYHPHDHDHE